MCEVGAKFKPPAGISPLPPANRFALKAELQANPSGIVRCYLGICILVTAAITLELWVRVVANWGISPGVDPLLGTSNRITAFFAAGLTLFVFLCLVALKDRRTKCVLILWCLVLAGAYRSLRWVFESGDPFLTCDLFSYLPLPARGRHIMTLVATFYLWGGSIYILTSEILKRRWQQLSPGYRRAFVIGGWATALALAVPPLQVAYVAVKNPPTTGPMILRQRSHSDVGSKPTLYQWKPLDPALGELVQVLLTAEDRRFFQHYGFDWRQIRIAISRSYQTGQRIAATSTITQQCARSLFLWQGRSWVRKGLEAYYTLWMELILSKRRILELYVNVVEFGDGIYGIEAAAQHYYGVPASQLTREQAAMLVAIMPSPKKWDPLNPNERVLKRQKRILENAANYTLPEGLLK